MVELFIPSVEIYIPPAGRGTKMWLLRGNRHRANGPALVYNNGQNTLYFWYGRQVTEYEHMMLAAQEKSND